MVNRNRRFWAIRTDKNNSKLLFSELVRGRMRQGWGYDDTQDLRIIQREIDQGGKWWERLTEEQKEALPHLRMLSDAEDSIQMGDILLLPNLPQPNLFCFAEVVGQYYFEMLPLDEETDVNELGRDYGHILSVKLITKEGIEKYNNHVHADIRSTLRTPMRMWNLDAYAQHIEALLSLHHDGEDLVTPSSGSARLNIAWENAMSQAKKVLCDSLAIQLDSKFQASEWEEPILTVLKRLYPGLHPRWTAGAQEQGADIIIQIPNHFGGVPWLILIQVKNYTGEIGKAVLSQIKQAYDYYSKEGKILMGVIMTTAEKESEDFIREKENLENELNIPIKLVLRKHLIDIMSEGLPPKD